MSSGKWRPFCLGRNVLTYTFCFQLKCTYLKKEAINSIGFHAPFDLFWYMFDVIF